MLEKVEASSNQAPYSSNTHCSSAKSPQCFSFLQHPAQPPVSWLHAKPRPRMLRRAASASQSLLCPHRDQERTVDHSHDTWVSWGSLLPHSTRCLQPSVGNLSTDQPRYFKQRNPNASEASCQQPQHQTRQPSSAHAKGREQCNAGHKPRQEILHICHSQLQTHQLLCSYGWAGPLGSLTKGPTLPLPCRDSKQ